MYLRYKYWQVLTSQVLCTQLAHLSASISVGAQQHNYFYVHSLTILQKYQ